MALRKNLIANFLGQAWTGLIGLIFLPLYISYLGIEAYGLIGIYAVLQAWLVLLDMGMAPTLNREMARFSAGAHTPQSIGNLLRSLEIVAVAVSVLITLGIWVVADWLASNWLKANQLSVGVVAQAIAIMGGVAALRLVEGIYRGALLGLQKQVFFNLASSTVATVRAVGAVAVLAWISPTIETYFIWQGLVSLVSAGILAAATHMNLPAMPSPVKFSRQALMEIRQFAGGMMATMFLALLLTQADKILLSRLISLEDFGYYTLAATVAAALALLINPVAQAYYPRFSELVAQGDVASLASNFHRGAQLVSALVAPAAMMLVFFGEEIIAIWTGDQNLADQVAPLLALLALGTLLNGFMHIPYMLQLAHGWTSMAVKMNLVAVIVLVPAILWATPRYGAAGAAWIWVLLNVGYVLIGIHLMYRRLLKGEKWKWYRQDLIAPLIAAIAVIVICKLVQPSIAGGTAWLAWLLVCATCAHVAAVMASSCLRDHALILFRRRRAALLK